MEVLEDGVQFGVRRDSTDLDLLDAVPDFRHLNFHFGVLESKTSFKSG